jgi:hypothetical protein
VAPTEVVVGRLAPAGPADLRGPKQNGHRPLRMRDTAAYAAAKRSPKGPKGSAIRQAASPRAATQAVAFPSSSFAGISDEQQATATSTRWEPPDTQLAAGPTALVEMVNAVGRIYNKSGAPTTPLFALRQWFGMPANYEGGDPRILFDGSAQRWYATLMGFDPSTGGSEVILAVSTTSNPAGAWRRYVVYRHSTMLCDQPKVGYSSDKIVIGCTDFLASPPPVGGVIVVASKAQALAGRPLTLRQHGPDPELFGMVPAQNMDSGKPAYIVLNVNEANAGLITITGDPAAGAIGLTGVLVPLTAPTTIPPLAPQSGSASTIDTGDDRFNSAVVQNSELWTSGGTGCTPAGDTVVRACMKVLEIGVAGPTNDLESTSGMNGKHLFYPTLGLDANDNIAIDYSLSSAGDFPSHGAMIQRAGQLTPTDKGILQAGSGAYVPNTDSIHRWGDYGAVARDPIEPTRLWVAGEYSIGPDWGTGLAAIDFTSLSLSPTGIGFGPQLVGTTSAAQVLSVTNQSDAQVTITDGLSSGDTSQFSYSVNGCSTMLASLSTCTVDFTFNPTSAGVKQARFSINAPHYVRSLVLSGIGAGPNCTSAGIKTDLTSPQYAGTFVNLQASSAGCGHLSPLYRFYLRSPEGVWSVIQDFSINFNYQWNTTGVKPATYLIGVWVKDAQSTTTTYDAYAFGTFTVQVHTCTSTNIGSDVGSPQQPGATVHFTATAAGCTQQFFQWWVRDKAGVWNIGSFYGLDNNAFTWDTTGLPMGTYQIGVWAKQQGNPKLYEAFAFVTYTLTTVPVVSTTHCEAVNISAVPASPSDQTTPVTFTAVAQGCTAEYRWWVRDTSSHWSAAPGYSATDTYSFTPLSRPAGTYLVGVWVRQTGSAASYEVYSFITYTITLAPANRVCSSVGISPDVASPQAPGTTVTFTASAAGCSVPTYKFWLLPPGGTWAIVQNYGVSNSYVWDTTGLAPGPYQIGVWARRSGSGASYETFAFITYQLQVVFATPCTILALSTSPDQVISQGSAIQFTAAAGNCSAPVFQFYLRKGAGAFSVTQAYSATNTFTWTPTGGTSGQWTLEVVARDILETSAYDTVAFTDFTVN